MAKILIVIPHDGFKDEELEKTMNALKKAGHHVEVGSTHHTEARGHFGMLIVPDVNVRFVELVDYDCLIFTGGRGIEEYVMDNGIMNMIKNAFADRKLLCAIGMAVEIFAYAGVLTDRKVTCDTSTIPKVEGAGAFYTGRLVEQDGELITGLGVEAVDAFAKQITSALEWRDERKAPIQ